MNRLAKTCVVSAIALSLAGCVSAPYISIDSKPSADLTRYQTYGFVEKPGTDREGYSTLLTGHFKAAVQQEMHARGYRLVEKDPELQVNFFSNVENRSETRNSPRMSIGYIHYRGGVSVGFPITHNDIDTRNYKVGTITLDIIDARAKELIWSGVLEGALSRKAMENPAGAVQSAVTQIFNRYPVAKAVTTPTQ